MKRGSWYELYGSCFLTFILLVVFSLSLFAYAQDYEFVENPALRQAQSGERSRTTKGGGRDYIVRNPKGTLPPPSGIPLAKMDSAQQEYQKPRTRCQNRALTTC